MAARLRDAVSAAHEDAVRAMTAAQGSGLAVNRDLVELIELQRRIIRIADQLDDGSAAVEASGAPPESEAAGDWPWNAFPWDPAQASGVRLLRGGNVSLSGRAPNLAAVAVGLGWDVRATVGDDFDLDASALAVGGDQRVPTDQHFVFYNNLRSPDGAIEHTGDHLTGSGAGDDEVITVDLVALPPTVTNVVFSVSIHDAELRGQTFGQVRNAYIRVVDRATETELARYDLTEDAAEETAVVCGELYRHGAEWKFRAIGRGYASGLAGIARDYGIEV